MNLRDRIHDRYIYGRRVKVLAEHLSRLIPVDAEVLDIGCGDGLIARTIAERRGDVRFSGVDVILRPQTHIPAVEYDGFALPFPEHSFDAVMLVDVLHHTDDPALLLREARRVSRGVVLIKDHLLQGILAGPTLRMMDRVGNARHGVALPFNYWPRQRWQNAFLAEGLKIREWIDHLYLYPVPLAWICDREMHFIARLETA